MCNLVSQPGIESDLPHWEHGVLATGQPVKSQGFLYIKEIDCFASAGMPILDGLLSMVK